MYCVSQVFLKVSARNLKIAKNVNKKFSTRCSLLINNDLNENYVEIDKTEFSDDCLNPEWDKKFMIAFKFSEIKKLRFDVYQSLEKVGESKISLTELITAKDGFTMKSIKSDNSSVGKLLITCEELLTTKEAVLMQFSGKNLDQKDIFGLSDPYLVISNIDGNGNMIEVYKSEVIKQNVSPVWQPIKIRTKTLCQTDKNMKLQLDCYDWDSDIKGGNKVDFIGNFDTTLEQLLIGPSDENKYELINQNKLSQHLETYKNSGIISLDKISVVIEKSFLDYLRNGVQFHMKIAIDFTSFDNFKNSINAEIKDSFDKSNAYFLFIENFGKIIEQFNYEKIWMASGLNTIFEDSKSTDNELKADEFYKGFEEIIDDIELKSESTKSLKKDSNKTIIIEPTIDRTIESIETIIKSDLINKQNRYFILLLLTSQLNKESIKNIDTIIDNNYSKPISIFIININGNDKDIQDITDFINHKKKSNKRKFIEV